MICRNEIHVAFFLLWIATGCLGYITDANSLEGAFAKAVAAETATPEPKQDNFWVKDEGYLGGDRRFPVRYIFYPANEKEELVVFQTQDGRQLVPIIDISVTDKDPTSVIILVDEGFLSRGVVNFHLIQFSGKLWDVFRAIRPFIKPLILTEFFKGEGINTRPLFLL